MFKKLFDGRAQAGARPHVAEAAAEFTKALYQDRRIEGTTKCTANKCCRGFWRHIDGLIHRRDLCDCDATVDCI